ncbi:unnamed protein product [Vitrella brassicaformis CCMP3155]|uniref:Tyrosine-protein kinase ephrin type A/B receptor-like domain-containing protein n=2 Tax=Vitrella brassicaformis TaxID=1169539 RepID=A0A0G4EIK5_VITBC|nr:unnamed protein product [Vitrella brassicaformis CCMP3155]|eukprot:CEL95717.1 unnamed protein product [Vitrella brassicaformis CCMP3155]
MNFNGTIYERSVVDIAPEFRNSYYLYCVADDPSGNLGNYSKSSVCETQAVGEPTGFVQIDVLEARPVGTNITITVTIDRPARQVRCFSYDAAAEEPGGDYADSIVARPTGCDDMTFTPHTSSFGSIIESHYSYNLAKDPLQNRTLSMPAYGTDADNMVMCCAIDFYDREWGETEIYQFVQGFSPVRSNPPDSTPPSNFFIAQPGETYGPEDPPESHDPITTSRSLEFTVRLDETGGMICGFAEDMNVVDQAAIQELQDWNYWMSPWIGGFDVHYIAANTWTTIEVGDEGQYYYFHFQPGRMYEMWCTARDEAWNWISAADIASDASDPPKYKLMVAASIADPPVLSFGEHEAYYNYLEINITATKEGAVVCRADPPGSVDFASFDPDQPPYDPGIYTSHFVDMSFGTPHEMQNVGQADIDNDHVNTSVSLYIGLDDLNMDGTIADWDVYCIGRSDSGGITPFAQVNNSMQTVTKPTAPVFPSITLSVIEAAEEEVSVELSVPFPGLVVNCIMFLNDSNNYAEAVTGPDVSNAISMMYVPGAGASHEFWLDDEPDANTSLLISPSKTFTAYADNETLMNASPITPATSLSLVCFAELVTISGWHLDNATSGSVGNAGRTSLRTIFSLSSGNDTVAPEFTSEIGVIAAQTSLTLTIRTLKEEFATVWFILTDEEADPPDASSVEANGTQATRSDFSGTEHEHTITFSGLTPATTQMAYAVAKDMFGNAMDDEDVQERVRSVRRTNEITSLGVPFTTFSSVSTVFVWCYFKLANINFVYPDLHVGQPISVSGSKPVFKPFPKWIGKMRTSCSAYLKTSRFSMSRPHSAPLRSAAANGRKGISEGSLQVSSLTNPKVCYWERSFSTPIEVSLETEDEMDIQATAPDYSLWDVESTPLQLTPPATVLRGKSVKVVVSSGSGDTTAVLFPFLDSTITQGSFCGNLTVSDAQARGYPVTQNGNTETSSFVFQFSSGTYAMCYSGVSSVWGYAFNKIGTTFSIGGPDANQDVSCVKRQVCTVGPIEGDNLDGNDLMRIMPLGQCGTTDASGFPGSDGSYADSLSNAAVYTAGTGGRGSQEYSFGFGTEIITADAGQYSICWCDKPSYPCDNASGFTVDVGTLSVVGPTEGQSITCYKGDKCIIAGLTGQGLQAGDQIIIRTTPGSCDTGNPVVPNLSATGKTEPGELNGDGVLEFQFGTEPADTINADAGVYGMCYCSSALSVDCSVEANFKLDAGTLTVAGPTTNQVLSCFRGARCRVRSLDGAGLVAGDRLLIRESPTGNACTGAYPPSGFGHSVVENSLSGDATANGDGTQDFVVPDIAQTLSQAMSIEAIDNGDYVEERAIIYTAPSTSEMCWCDSIKSAQNSCTFALSAGTLRIAGPNTGAQNQNGVTTTTFSIEVEGLYLTNTSRIKVIDSTGNCGQIHSSDPTASDLTGSVTSSDAVPSITSGGQKATYSNYQFSVAGTYKVCWWNGELQTDAELAAGQDLSEWYTIDVGNLTVTGPTLNQKFSGIKDRSFDIRLKGLALNTKTNPRLLIIDESAQCSSGSQANAVQVAPESPSTSQSTVLVYRNVLMNTIGEYKVCYREGIGSRLEVGVIKIEDKKTFSVDDLVEEALPLKNPVAVTDNGEEFLLFVQVDETAGTGKLQKIKVTNNDMMEKEYTFEFGSLTLSKPSASLVVKDMHPGLTPPDRLFLLDEHRIIKLYWWSAPAPGQSLGPLTLIFGSSLANPPHDNNNFYRPSALAHAGNHRIVVLKVNGDAAPAVFEYQCHFGETFKFLRETTGLYSPAGIAYGEDTGGVTILNGKYLFVADQLNHRLMILEFGVTGVAKKSDEGLANPNAVSYYDGLVVVGELDNNRLVVLDVRKLSTDSSVTFLTEVTVSDANAIRGLLTKVPQTETRRRLKAEGEDEDEAIEYEPPPAHRNLDGSPINPARRLSVNPCNLTTTSGWLYFSTEKDNKYSQEYNLGMSSVYEAIKPVQFSYTVPTLIEIDGTLRSYPATLVAGFDKVDCFTSGTLPSSLSVNAATGALEGTPNIATAEGSYRIYAHNVAATTSFDVTFGVYCLQGNYYDTTTDTCKACPQGQYAPRGNTLLISCSACSAVRAQSTTTEAGKAFQADCLCTYGFEPDVSGACKACPIGKYKDSISDNTCTDCGGGRTTNATGMTAEANCVCEIGYALLDGACQPCEQGKYCPTVGGQPQSCPIGFNTVGTGARTLDECLCDEGYTWRDETCKPCVIGTFKGDVSNQQCTQCPYAFSTTDT